MSDRHDALLPLGGRDFWTRAAATVQSAIRTSRTSIAVCTLVFAAAGVLAARVTPQTFSTDARLLVRRADLMPALAHPRRSVPTGSDNLTQSAADFVRDRQALRAIVERFDLVRRWQRDRSPLLKLKDAVTARLRGPMSEADRTEALIDVLARRILVTVNGEVITVWARWSDAATAVDIVQGATDAYLEARRRVDIDAIADTYSLLERSVEAARLEVEQHVAATRLAPRRRLGAVMPVGMGGAATPATIDPLADAKAEVTTAEKAADALATTHAAVIRTLEAQLSDRLARATDKHPDVIALRRQLEQARVIPDAVHQARQTATMLRDRLDRVVVVPRPPASQTSWRATAPEPASGEDEEQVYARSLLESAIASYQDLLDRLSNTRIELETARAAFDYRYTVISDARRPHRPDSPSGLLMIAGAVCAGLAAGVGRAVLREVRP